LISRQRIDVRSPSEYRRGHIPGAINISLLDDEGRAIVGTAYKNFGKSVAVQLGLEIVAANIGQFSECVQEISQPLEIYCWRGGLRSGAAAIFLRACGMSVAPLPGGYRAYRRAVQEQFTLFSRERLIVLDGQTGVGKSEMLRSLTKECRTIDFEGLAVHRGSAFGDFGLSGSSPTQQQFENQIYEVWQENVDRPGLLVVEFENYIGPCQLPRQLREHVKHSPTFLLERDLPDRITRLVSEYTTGWNTERQQEFESKLPLLKKYLEPSIITDLVHHSRRGEFATVVAILLEKHYDPAYQRSIRRRDRQCRGRFHLTGGENHARQDIIRAALQNF
jgi:tRNA 2-selenouridine synthase